MEIRVEVFDKICRVCLSECANMKSLFTKIDGDNRNLYDVFASAANIQFKFDDTLPKQVCNECEAVMCKADAFKKRCLESDTILNNVYKSSREDKSGSIKSTECAVKDETSDTEHNIDVIDPFQATNSSDCYFKHGCDTKNVLLQEFEVCTTFDSDSSKIKDSKLQGNIKHSIKTEILNNISDHNNLLNDYNDEIQIDMVPTAYNHKEIKRETEYICYCGTELANKQKYDNHTKYCIEFIKLTEMGTKIVTNLIPIKNRLHCVDCDLDFDTPYTFTIHQRKHNKVKQKKIKELYQCSTCLRKYKSKTTLSKHMKRHKEPNKPVIHTCEVCKREFKYKAYLASHILTMHSRSDGFICDICSKAFSSQEGLEIHKQSHCNERKHQCNICKKGFVMLCTLKEHMRTHTGERPFLCSQCGRGFSQKTNLAQHMRRHQGVKAFKCETCEKRFVSKGELDAHNRKHSGAHPFVCDECGNGFTTSSALVKHRRVHTGERPYLCDLCPMRFAASGTLANHRRTHTGERPFQCSHCEKAFVQKYDLISHIRCHTGERPYVCAQCGQAFRKAAGLKAHVKMHGKEGVGGLHGVVCNEQ